MKVKVKYLAIPIVALLILGLSLSLTSNTSVSSTEGLKYNGMVCVGATLSGKYYDLGCRHNLITNVGKDHIKTASGQGAAIRHDKIAVANNTVAQAATDTTLQGEWTTCGLAAATGTYSSAGTGAWNITYQWTSSCDSVIVNATGLYNATGTNQLFAETTFTSVTLQTNDKLNVTWGLQVS
jgi:hypothetical protein